MRYSCWITKATNTHLEYVILIAFARRLNSREGASVLHYMYIACLVGICSQFLHETAYIVLKIGRSFRHFGKKKGKAFPLQAWTGPSGFQEFEAPEFLDNRHLKVVRLSALRTGCLYPQE
jgi:hypothetical protein